MGFPDKLDYMAEKLLSHNMVFGMVEHYTQLQFAPMEGLIPMAEKMDYQVARSYIIDKAEQRKLKMPELCAAGHLPMKNAISASIILNLLCCRRTGRIF